MKTKVSDIHQIELTSRCNLRCKYCPSPHLQRPKVDISWDDFKSALALACHFQRQGTQGELNMAGIGESTLHPDFLDMLTFARRTLGYKQRILFATNGILFDENIAKHCRALAVHVYVSMHRPEKAGPAINLARKYGVLHGASSEPALAATNWAGQVDWEVTAPPDRPCMWLQKGKVMVMADGRITTCSFDASGAGVIGHVQTQNIEGLEVRPYKLCASCDHCIIPGKANKDLVDATSI
jgi:hypothetical protein